MNYFSGSFPNMFKTSIIIIIANKNLNVNKNFYFNKFIFV